MFSLFPKRVDKSKEGSGIPSRNRCSGVHGPQWIVQSPKVKKCKKKDLRDKGGNVTLAG